VSIVHRRQCIRKANSCVRHFAKIRDIKRSKKKREGKRKGKMIILIGPKPERAIYAKVKDL